MNRIHKETYKGYTISIFPDEDAGSPREENDNLGHMVCFHRRSNYGDKSEFKTPEQLFEFMQEERPIFMPIFAYEHGSIVLSTRNDVYPFNDQWDAGWLGVIYITREEVVKEYGPRLSDGKSIILANSDPLAVPEFEPELIALVKNVLEGEIQVYNQWLNGEFCGYVIDDANHTTVDSTWGYESVESAVASAKEQIDYLVAQEG